MNKTGSLVLPRFGQKFFGLLMGAPLLLWQAIFFLFPITYIVILSFYTVEFFQIQSELTLSSWIHIYSADFFWSAFGRSLLGASVAVILINLVAFPCSYFIGIHCKPLTRKILTGIMLVPFFTNYVIRAYSWRNMLGEEGVVNFILAVVGLGPFTMTNNLFGTVVGYATLALPLVLLLQVFALSFVDRRLIEASYNLGASGVRTLFKVIIPSARVGLILALAFSFVLTFGDFVSPTFIGGNRPPVLSTLLVDQIRAGNHWPRASVVAITMFSFLFAVVASALWLAYRRGGR